LYPFNYRGMSGGNDTLQRMNPQSIALVFAGAGAGGVARLLLNHWLNPLFAPMPLGTLTANVLGSGAAGALVGLLGVRADLDPVLRPLLIVGFLGGLTTFSSFSLEVVQALEQQRAWVAGGIAVVHVCASVAAAVAGLLTVRALVT
jgi:fluoride exporter